ncbi:GT2 family glycosyltransferase [Sphingomonas vulcanisoli]|uniref:GT2 family glycosyltransferase n=1 Tax=Sphingomonas vulcanisoli TaxID=1658060 RepID=A0ABX0TUC6_9SPHN|nr:GT2 family glycosyltransferase [Sphingomonas vulcanisoli]
MQARSDNQAVTAVIVTYGARERLVLTTLDAARAGGLDHAIVIDNGSATPIAPAAARFGDWVTVVRLDRNRGSAAGFAAGIEAALAAGYDRLLMLDDDNAVRTDTLPALIAAFDAIKQPGVPAAVLALRAGHGGQRLDHTQRGVTLAERDTAFGFHIADMAGKIARRLFKRGKETGAIPTMLPIPAAPYGGLLIDRETIERIGLPDERYGLYQDDHEYTIRILRQGGALMLVPGALIDDLEPSYNDALSGASSFARWLRGPSDFRVFYTFRNMAHLDRYRRGPTGPLFRANRALFLTILRAMALKEGRMARYRLLRRALADADREKLGIDPAFPLP